ncbi:FliM/FliN family flagellar motor switch protein [Rubellimicrobium roseum]|uniref:FliM/FliN family flagellar motor switch protein n=1 Tax=Rubellimicrobium roseum TaxID=687525 RepID=A0A5C4NGD7_9RHOB|nr:FliM/FliN family flagellar motor C-terminal domain-containing protein [Rubellimicrobium roseum]TNC73874.1 FliM/FliN family flagellar motor switch protein [Rubellimicrobium roseum]
MRRLVRPPAPPAAITPARALRLAATRAAERSISLPLAVLGVSEEEGPLDDLLGRLEDGLMLIALHEDDHPVGLVALDAEARAAVLEVQTLGRVAPAVAEVRVVTAADAALARPFLQALLAEVEAGTAGTVLDGWVRGPALAARLPGPREAAMILSDGLYRIVRLTLDLGAGGRQGLALLLIRLRPPPEPAWAEPPAATVADPVLAAPATLTAVLHRLQLPLAGAEALEVGQVLALPGVTVASVRLEVAGIDLGPARLGQMAGMRALRIEEPLTPGLDELPSLGEGAGPAALPPTVAGWPS